MKVFLFPASHTSLVFHLCYFHSNFCAYGGEHLMGMLWVNLLKLAFIFIFDLIISFERLAILKLPCSHRVRKFNGPRTHLLCPSGIHHFDRCYLVVTIVDCTPHVLKLAQSGNPHIIGHVHQYQLSYTI